MQLTRHVRSCTVPSIELSQLARCNSTGTADAQERHLSLSVDHADFENRIRTWDAHEARLRRLSSVL